MSNYTKKKKTKSGQSSKRLSSPAKQHKEGYGDEDEEGDVEGQPRIAGREG